MYSPVKGLNHVTLILPLSGFGRMIFTLSDSLGEVLTLHHNGSAIDMVHNSGFDIDGEGRALANLSMGDGSRIFIVSQHQGPVKVFKEQFPMEDSRILVLGKNEFKVEFFKNGENVGVGEYAYGQGYLSQSSRKVLIPGEIEKVVVSDFSGRPRTVLFESK